MARTPTALNGLQRIAMNRVAIATTELAEAEAAAEAARIKWHARMFSASRQGVPHQQVAAQAKIGDDRYRVIRDKYGYAGYVAKHSAARIVSGDDDQASDDDHEADDDQAEYAA